jgi:hypothetical protein
MAELYNYSLFESNVVFDLLYVIVLLGHGADPRVCRLT